MKYKKYLVIYLAAMMAAGTMTGCGNRNTGIEPAETNVSVTETTETEDAVLETAETKVYEYIYQNEDIKLSIGSGIKDGMHNIFQGYVGEEEVRMNVSRKGDYITIGIINRKDEEKILSGKIQKDGKHIQVTNTQNEYIIGYLTENMDEVIEFKGEVSFEELNNTVSMNLHPDTFFEIGENENNYYEVNNYNGISAEEAEGFAKEIKSKVGNKEEFVELLQYKGFSVNWGGDRHIIKSKEEALLYYDKIMEYTDFQQFTENMFTKYMFANYMGVCMDRGQIWFVKYAEGIRICSINLSEPLSGMESYGKAAKQSACGNKVF